MPNCAPNSIEFNGVRHTFTTRGKSAMLALDGVDLKAGNQEFLALLGPSGCGKSTLLYLLGGFVPIQEGTIVVNGKLVTGPGPDRGVVFQNFALFPWKTVRENVLFGLEKKRLPKKEREEIADHFISLVQLQSFANSFPEQLSGGMKQRVAIARTLAIDPDVLLMDEPFGALDAQTRRLMQEELLAVWRRSPKTVVFVTHDVREAVILADRVAVMTARPGRIREVVDTKFEEADFDKLSLDRRFIEKQEYLWNIVREEAQLAATKN
jgi:NitT/TauT family transport system ATP-binding protein